MQATQLQQIVQSNDSMAASNRMLLRERGVMMFEIAGLPGSGRTTLLAATLRQLYGMVRVGVIVADPAGLRDYGHLSEYCQQLVSLDVPHIDASWTRDALAQLDLDALEWVFVESTGGQLAPLDLDLGQSIKAAVFGVAGGDEKPIAQPQLTGQADAIVVSQLDLMAHVPFDVERFTANARTLNASAPLFGVSALHGHGMKEWTSWLKRFRISKSPLAAEPDWQNLLQDHSEWYVG